MATEMKDPDCEENGTVGAALTESQQGGEDLEMKNSISQKSASLQTEGSGVEDSFTPPSRILPCIVLSQFAGTSLWFAGNAVLSDFADEFDLPDSSLELLTSSVQAGFIVGTLGSAVVQLVDRFPPTTVFAASALLGAIANASIPWTVSGLVGMMMLRFLTGVTLAGIYPVGMKIAADWYQRQGLGQALGLLVGALVAGTAFPFLLRQLPQTSWQWLLYETSALAALGGLIMWVAVPNGPHRQASKGFQPSLLWTLFEQERFRYAAMGYFGHMWELYAFWAWTPVVWEAYLNYHSSPEAGEAWDASIVTFVVISMGALGCWVGGILASAYGSDRVACMSLVVSGSCCILSPLVYYFVSTREVALIFYLIWGTTVASDSPQLSTLVASTSAAENKGTALTLVNCLGFSVSIASIQLLGVPLSEPYLFLLLTPGPVFGIHSLWRFMATK